MSTRPNIKAADPERVTGVELPHPPPSTLLSLADGLDRVVSILAQAIVVVTGCALLALLTANVVARYTLGGGFAFAQELPERLFPFFIMAGVTLAAQRGGHMAVELIPDLLGRRGKQVVRIIAQLCVVTGHGVLVVVAFDVAGISWIDKSPVLGLPASLSYYAIAGGAAAVIVATLALIVRLFVIGADAMPTPNPEELGL